MVEREIKGIVRDQRKVIDLMKSHLKNYERADQNDDFDDKIIGSYLDMHRVSLGGLALQASGLVKTRATEKELVQNFELLADLQQFMRPTTVIERVPLSPVKGRSKLLPNGAGQAQVSESRRKFMAALKCAKPQTQLVDLESEGEEDDGGFAFLEEQMYPQLYQPDYDYLAGGQGEPVRARRKRRPGRPSKKSNLELLMHNNLSAPSTRPTSPEVVTMPYVDLPEEPVETNDYDQESFLLRFGLYTHEMRERIRTRRPERRRRNVQSTEKTDFHYGHIESVMVSLSGKGRNQRVVGHHSVAFSLSLQKERTAALGTNNNNNTNKRPPQQYLSPRTFKKRRTFDRSASSSPPNEFCLCGPRNGEGGDGFPDNLNYSMKTVLFQATLHPRARSAAGGASRSGIWTGEAANFYPLVFVRIL